MPTSNSETPEAAKLEKTTLLLVDDQPSNLIALEAVLSSPEYDLVSVHSGAEAIEVLKTRHDIALILLDIQMPEMDGFETAKRIKELESCRDIPIIFITAVYREDPFIRKGYEVGAVDYFSKPFDPELLKLKVGIYSAFRQKAYLIQVREKRIKEAEELWKAKQKLSHVLENLGVGILVFDTERRVLQLNEKMASIWGFPKTKGKSHFKEFLKWWNQEKDRIETTSGLIDRVLESGESTHNEVTHIMCFDGTAKSVLTSVSSLRNTNAFVVGVVVIIQDVTEHKQIERDMERRIQKLVSLGVDFPKTAEM